MFISLLLRSSYDGFSSLLSISIAPDFNWLDLLSLLPEFFLWSWFVLCTSFWSLLIAWVRGGSRTAGTSRMEHFVIIVNGWKPWTIITKSSILDVAAVLDPPLTRASNNWLNGEPFSNLQRGSNVTFYFLSCNQLRISWTRPGKYEGNQYAEYYLVFYEKGESDELL